MSASLPTRPLRQSRSSAPARSRLLRLEPLEDRRLLAGRAAEAINLFAIDVYEHMQRSQGNLFFSPLSVATSLAMAYAGAGGQTAAEMEEVLHIGPEPGIHAAFGELIASIESHNESWTWPVQRPPHLLTVANALWQDADFPVDQDYLNLIETDYGGHVGAVDYANPQQAQNIINQWVSNHTEGKIPNLVSNLTPNTAMVLTNAIYFNGYWGRPFDPQYTANRPFKLASGETIQTPTMYTELSPALYAVFTGYQVLELPFDGGANDAAYSMVFVLPPESGPDDLTPELYARIEDWLDGPQQQSEVLVLLPKIDTAVSTSLKQLLVDLGMPTSFELGAADFSPMGLSGVAINDVFHKTTITMNEQGTTAAAATEIDFFICFAADTPVMTPDGPRPIDELKEGDLVLARDEHNLEGNLAPKRIEKVHHRTADILELRVGGQLIRTTETHPFFVRGKGWTPASELRPRDRLSTSAGDWVEVDAVQFTKATEPVYNLRVADYHTYFVGRDEWKFAVWVHNACGGEPEFFADRPFHLMIRDNLTSTIAFMGRIDDPRQTQNSVAPVVIETSADFDGDQTTDGADFLAWQRGYGAASGATRSSGDSNADGDVDANDLAYWKQAFGQTDAPLAAAALASETPPSTPSVTPGAAYLAELIDAAMALAWLTPGDSCEDALLVDDPDLTPRQTIPSGSHRLPAVMSVATLAVEPSTPPSVDEQPAVADELDDAPLALQDE